MNQLLRSLTPQEVKQIYQRIPKDFAAGEYQPYWVMKKLLQQGVMEGFYYLQEGVPTAYLFCSPNPETNTVLISLISVFPEYRNRGIGSALFRTLSKYYRNYAGIYIEVEKPELAKKQQEKEIRQRRVRFYRRVGFHSVPQLPNYVLYGIPYHIMALPLSAPLEELQQFAKNHLTNTYRRFASCWKLLSKWQMRQLKL